MMHTAPAAPAPAAAVAAHQRPGHTLVAASLAVEWLIEGDVYAGCGYTVADVVWETQHIARVECTNGRAFRYYGATLTAPIPVYRNVPLTD